MSKIYEVFGTNAHEMALSLLRAANAAALIPAGASVALKPNLVLAAPAEDGATTHPGVLSGVMEYLREQGVRDISVIEGSWVGARTGSAFRTAGYEEICRHYDVPFYDLKQDTTRAVSTPAGSIRICERALNAGLLINLPVLKGHCQTVMTCALKNCKGCIPDTEKRRFHADGLTRPIAALAAALRPGLTLVDSICGDLDFEEGGNPIPTNRMLLGTDGVQLDTYCCGLMGLSPADVPYIALAEQWGGGSMHIGESDVITLNAPEQSAVYPAPSGKVARLTSGVEAREACSACYAALVRALHRTGRARERIAIGQGWRDQPFEGLGVGSCCNCATACVPGCPPAASEIAQALRSI